MGTDQGVIDKSSILVYMESEDDNADICYAHDQDVIDKSPILVYMESEDDNADICYKQLRV